MQGKGTRVKWGGVTVLVSLSVCTLRQFGGRARHLKEGVVTSTILAWVVLVLLIVSCTTDLLSLQLNNHDVDWWGTCEPPPANMFDVDCVFAGRGRRGGVDVRC